MGKGRRSEIIKNPVIREREKRPVRSSKQKKDHKKRVRHQKTS